MNKKLKFEHPRLLPPVRQDTPVFPKEGDEIYYNGVFFFHVSAMLKWLEQNPQPRVEIATSAWGPFPGKEEHYVEAADLTRPILVAEIAPDYRDFIPDIPEKDWRTRGYVCIDGQHRIEKARGLGIETVPAVIIRMEQHIPFLYEGYDHYAEYWNGKLRDRSEDALRWKRRQTE